MTTNRKTLVYEEAVVNKNKIDRNLATQIFERKKSDLVIENLSLEDLEEVLGDFYTELN